MATYSNIFADQGSDFSTQIDLSDSVNFDMSTYTAAGRVAKSYDGSTKATFAASINAEEKIVTISLTASQTALLKPGRYLYDVIIVSADSPPDVTRILEGQIDVTPGVTFDSSAPES